MPARVQVSEVIDRPVAEVFDFYARQHVRNHPRWDPDMELEQLTDGAIGVGTIIRRRNSHGPTPVDGTMEVVEFEPDRAFGVVIRDGETQTLGRATFEAVEPGRTRLIVDARFPDVEASAEGSIQRLVERSLGNIKRLIESGA